MNYDLWNQLLLQLLNVYTDDNIFCVVAFLCF